MMTAKTFILAAAILVFAPSVAVSADLSGTAKVIDGDSLSINGQQVRLFGVDAPEFLQECLDETGRAFACGREAADHLRDRIGRETVTCQPRDIDPYNRIVAVCTVGGADVAAWLVSNGLAMAYRYFSRDYVALEDEARGSRLGFWRGTFENPYDWKRAQSRRRK